MIIELFAKKLQPITVRGLVKTDHEDLFCLHSGNIFYNSCLQKEKITKQQVLDGLSALPPNTKTEQKFYVGFFYDENTTEPYDGELADSISASRLENRLIGCMDYIEGYPHEGTVFVGLFMLAAGLHGQGLGGRIIAAFAKSVQESGYKKIRLACLENNAIAYSFWTKQGFSESARKSDSDGRMVVVMEKGL